MDYLEDPFPDELFASLPPEPPDFWSDAPPPEYEATMFQAALELAEIDAPDLAPDSLFRALDEIGVAADGFDPAQDPPPFVEDGVAYWIGVFQPDRDDRDYCVTSILSVGRNPDSGEIEAQLAPCVPGDWDKAHQAAEYLVGLAQRGGIAPCFDAAEAMALATDQRALWETPLGMTLEREAADEIADYARETWEVTL